MSELIKINDLCVSYGGQKVLNGINLTVKSGEFCALLGLNGSGKTTLLNALCGFVKYSGEACVKNENLKGLNERKRAKLISYIPQVSGLREGRSVKDVVMMGFNPVLGLLENPSSVHRKTAEEIIARVGLKDKAEKDFGEISQGEKQLAILARCMVQNAPVMLMDEPESALDFSNKHKMMKEIKGAIKEKDYAGVIALHDPNFALAYCDRVLILKDGKIVGEILPESADEKEIEQKLSLIYGNVKGVKCEKGYLIGVNG